MSIDLLTMIEEEKDQWIAKAMGRFNRRFRFEGQSHEKEQELDEINGEKSPENQILQLKNIQQTMYRQITLELEQLDNEIGLLMKSIKEDVQRDGNLADAARYIQQEIDQFESLITEMDDIQLYKFNCLLYEKFEFDAKKIQVVFKHRKTSRLVESFHEVEREMKESYKQQLDEITKKFKQMRSETASSAKIEFHANPPVVELSLNHGRGLDQYLLLKNFEEDYQIAQDTLNEQNTIVYDYYLSQVERVKQIGKQELMGLCDAKRAHQQIALQDAEETQKQRQQKEKTVAELQEKRTRVQSVCNRGLDQMLKLDEFLKEEFVEAVSKWQEKMFAEEATDVERWMYHQYCQVILKQAERII
ncbi:hypothetical protein [Neobacillus sp. Marseille-QA0830]